MSFLYLWNETLNERRAGVNCPEVPERCDILKPEVVFRERPEVRWESFHSRNEDLLSLVHQSSYIHFVRDAFHNKRRALDSGDTRVTENTFEQALLSASAAPKALDYIFSGEISRAFCAIRPPGHHANRMRALGFCVFNNAAIAACYAQAKHGAERVLVVDWDVHPGNGTQEIFWEDSSVYTLSFHQRGLLGQSGEERFIGEGAGEGFNRNIEFAPGTSGKEYIPRFCEVLDEVVSTFRPDLIIVAAGFDAHERDLAADLKLQEEDYASLTLAIREQSMRYSEGRVLGVLEGGYNISALRNSVQAHCLALF